MASTRVRIPSVSKKEYLREARIRSVHEDVETVQACRLSEKKNHRETRLKGLSNQ